MAKKGKSTRKRRAPPHRPNSLNSPAAPPAKLQRIWQRAIAAQRCGDLVTAEESYLRLLQKMPGQPEAARNLGALYLETGRVDAAWQVLQDTLSRTPDAHEVRQMLADLLFGAERFAAAEPHYVSLLAVPAFTVRASLQSALCAANRGEQRLASERLEHLVNSHPGNSDVLLDAGTAARVAGMVDLAADYFLRARPHVPNDPVLLNNLGLCHVDRGEMAAAEDCFKAVLARDPGHADAWFNRVRLRRYSTGDCEQLEALAVALNAAGTDRHATVRLSYALAKVCHDLGRYADAMNHYERANRVQRALAPYDRVSNAAFVDGLIAAFSETRMAARDPVSSQLPVLIVGMPRSGTTLVEQILSSHPQIHGAGELANLAALTRELGPAGTYPASIATVPAEVLHDAARRYLTVLQGLGLGASRVTDKMPTNFLQLGLAAMMFDGVRIVHCRRDPMDTCFSNFIQFFANGHRYACDLDDVAHYYGLYRRLMEHWQRVLPLSILVTDYEAVVEDVEREARRLIQFVGLDWDPRCVEFHANARDVVTASNWQVRQPIYTDSAKRWHRYAEHLGPLQTALQREVPGIVLD